jgi:hypothetical protein
VSVVDLPHDAPARGTLTVEHRAATRLAQGALAAALPDGDKPDVEVLSLDAEGIELRGTVTLEYPSEPLSSVLARLRRQVAREVERQLGRHVRRLDLVVGSFITESPKPARRVV